MIGSTFQTNKNLVLLFGFCGIQEKPIGCHVNNMNFGNGKFMINQSVVFYHIVLCKGLSTKYFFALNCPPPHTSFANLTQGKMLQK